MDGLTKQQNWDFLEATFEHSINSIYWINSEGEIVFVNQAAQKALHYTKEELLKLHVWDVNPIVDSKEKFKSIYESFVQGYEEGDMPNVFESFHKTKEGKVFPVEIASKVVLVQGEFFLISYVKDITARIEKNRKIALYFDCIHNSTDIVFLVRSDTHKVEFANQAAMDKLGYTLEEFTQMRVEDFRQPIDEAYIETSDVFKAIQSSSMTTLGQYTCKDGSTFPVETSVSLKEYNDKNYVIAISRDIAERLELQRSKEEINQKLKHYNETLEEKVLKAKEELLSYEKVMYHQSKMAAMGEMLENIAHQWRQPLSIISVLSTGMKIQQESGTLSQEDLEEGLYDINENAQYLSKTIDDFSDFFKPNKIKTEFTLDVAIENALNFSASQVKSLEIEILKSIEDITVVSFQNEFVQVLINLLNNAKDALQVISNKRLIFICAYKLNNEVIVEVKDSAGGIKEDILEKVFEPYFTTKHKSQGTGIGLYMSEEIISKHMKGSLEVCNETFTFKGDNYQGAKFIIRFPI